MSASPAEGGADPPGRHLAWFHCFAGIAGDMALGSLVDAGADLDEVRSILRRMPIAGWELGRRAVLRGGIACTQAVCRRPDDAVCGATATSPGWSPRHAFRRTSTTRALAVFDALARVEARLHRRPAAHVHLHEAGGHDAIVDVVGTVAALEVLGIDEVRASPVATGTGTVRAAHGILPNPAPAVVDLLRGAPVRGVDIAARADHPHRRRPPRGPRDLLRPSARDDREPIRLRRGSPGPGGASQLHPGGARHGRGPGRRADDGQPVVVLEANVDDVTGEQLALAVRELLEAGAHDAWVSPVVMKKGRPGHVVHALADPALVASLRHVLRRSTGTFGARALSATRWPAARQMATVLVEGQPVRMKVGEHRAKPEIEDLVALSSRTGVPVRELQARAEEAWRAQRGLPLRPERGAAPSSSPDASARALSVGTHPVRRAHLGPDRRR